MTKPTPSMPDRRSFLTRLSAGVTALAAALATGTATAQAQTPAGGPWRPARHEKDDWLDLLPGKHRIVFDTTNADAFSQALLFAGNFIRTNRSAYNVESTDLTVLIIARHRSASLAFNDKMWEKYGPQLSARSGFVDPKTKAPPTANLFNSSEHSKLLSSRGTTLDSLLKLGAQFGVCATATRNVAGTVAEATGQKTDDVFNELAANLIGSTQARLVPAGVITVSRAQERGYTLITG